MNFIMGHLFFLWARVYPYPSTDAEALMLSVGGGYVEVIAMLLQASADPNRGILGVMPLMMAAASGQLEASLMCQRWSQSED